MIMFSFSFGIYLTQSIAVYVKSVLKMLETSGSKKKNVLITVFNGVKYIVYIIETIFEQ